MVTLKYVDGDYWLTVKTTTYIYDKKTILSVLAFTSKAYKWAQLAKNNAGLEVAVL